MARPKWMVRVVSLTVLLALMSVPCWSDDEVWGYLWELRTRQLHSLSAKSVLIGRLAQSDVVLQDSRVSRRHAEIRKGTDGIVVLDRGSSNGSYINGNPMPPSKAFPLEPGSFLIFGFEKVIYHRDKVELWREALQHTLLGSLVQLRVPMLSDRKVKALGMERLVDAVTVAAVDPEKMSVRLSYAGDAVPEQDGFQPNERAFVGNVSLEEGELRLSLWGLARGGSLVSRRASLTHLKHGELRVGLAGEDQSEAQDLFESRWVDEGLEFLLPLLEGVFGLSNREGLPVAVKFAESLLEQEDIRAYSDARKTTAVLHHLAPADSALPLLSARAEARWVNKRLETQRGATTDEQREEMIAALARGRTWLEKASELEADNKQVQKVEKQIAKTEKRLEGAS